MNEQLYIKYHEARLWVDADRCPHEQHEFALFYAESDWDDLRAAWIEFAAK